MPAGRTRAEHLEWCKKRALEYVPSDLGSAVASMMSDLGKHPETEASANPLLGMMGIQAAANKNVEEVRRFITGFN